MKSIIFVGDYDYDAKNEGELSFRVGDSIRIYQSEGDWWYGEALKTGEVGWVAPSYGHTREESPYINISKDIKIRKRNELFQNIIAVQSDFISVLFGFIESIITPLSLRDTAFKRAILGEPSVAVSFSLLQEIYNACSNFDSVLRRAKTDTEIANAYAQFAPSLQLFAQYASENSKLLHSIKAHIRQLSAFLSEGQSLETSLIMPLEHYTKYKIDFQEFVWLTSGESAEMDAIASALDIVIAQTDYVDAKLKEEEQSLLLLNLQDQFSGNPVIFTPSRRIVKDGELERVRLSKDGSIVSKTYFAHLFNDAFIYSARNIVTGRFKLHNVIDLKGAVLEKSSLTGVTCGFSLCAKDCIDKIEHFRFANEAEYNVWFSLVNDQVNSLKAHKIGKRSSVITRSNVSLPGVDVKNLGPRCALIYKFLLNELQFAEAMSLLNITVIQPLIDASKGAVLNACKITSSNIVTSGQEAGEGLQLREGQAKTRDALFDGTTSTQSRYQTQAVTDALQDADVQIFLRAAEGIALSLRDFVNALEVLCTASAWAETIVVGNFFNSVSALALYNQFKAYASGQQAMLRILKTQTFVPFYKESELFLSSSPGSFVDKIELPRKRVTHFSKFISDLQQLTPQNHPDALLVSASVDALLYMDRDIEELVRLKKNFEELLEIQSSLVSLKMIGSEPILQKLASMDRTIITQGDLKKVCRKKNKTFRFWLFNDYIIYGSALGGGKYTFNRALELSKCSVSLHTSTSLKHAFEIFGAEKSFIVIAASQASQIEWVERISKAKGDLICSGQVGVVNDTTEAEKIAPLWVPDNGSDTCVVCKQDFTFWNRRHHCRKCGALVCSDHSKNKEILTHIHKSAKQKICDNCFLGKTVLPGITTVTSAVVPTIVVAPLSSPVTSVQSSSNMASSMTTVVSPPQSIFDIVSEKTERPLSVKPVKPPKTFRAAPPPLAPTSDGNVQFTVAKQTSLEHNVPQSLPPPLPKFSPDDSSAPTSKPPPIPTSVSSNFPVQYSVEPSLITNLDLSPTSPLDARRSTEAPVKSRTSRAPPPPPPPLTAPQSAVVPNTSTVISESNVIPPVPTLKNDISPPPPPPPPPSTIKVLMTDAVVSEVEVVHTEDDSMRKYRKMLDMLPEGAVRQKMKSDGFGDIEVENFLERLCGKGTEQTASVIPLPPPSNVVSNPTPIVAVSLPQLSDVDDFFRKYIKMKEMLPSGAVRQKMLSDGYESSDIDAFLANEVASLPTPVTTTAPAISLMASLNSPPILRKAVAVAPLSRKVSLLDEIQNGSKLKSVLRDDTRMKAPAIQGAGGLLGMLASEMSKRRFNMKVEDEDEDSDSSGFSDSDSESEDDE